MTYDEVFQEMLAVLSPEADGVDDQDKYCAIEGDVHEFLKECSPDFGNDETFRVERKNLRRPYGRAF